MTRVSIVIPTRNAGPAFARTLEAISAQNLGEPYELVVVDSGSTDGTPALAGSYGARVIAIDPAEFGHGRTRNAGIAACAGEYVALLVQDAMPADGEWLAGLVAALEAHPRAAGAVSRCLPRPGAGFVERYLARRDALGVPDDDEPAERSWPAPEGLAALSVDDLRRVCAFDDVSSILRRAVWERHPLPDVAYAEDLAWGADVMRAGYSIVSAPASVVWHSHSRSLGYELRRAYVDRRALEALHAACFPAGGGAGVHPATETHATVGDLIHAMTGAAREEGALSQRVWWSIRARVLAGAIGVGLARYAGPGHAPWPGWLERCLTRGI